MTCGEEFLYGVGSWLSVRQETCLGDTEQVTTQGALTVLSAHQGFCKGSLDYMASQVPVSHVISKALETLCSPSEQVIY